MSSNQQYKDYNIRLKKQLSELTQKYDKLYVEFIKKSEHFHELKTKYTVLFYKKKWYQFWK